MAKIREEGLQRSKVMETASYLTDVFGPRLTNSPNIKAAAQWTTKKMTEWGLTEGEPRDLGTVWPRLVERADVCGDDEALCVSPYCLSARLDSEDEAEQSKVMLCSPIINTPEDMEDCRGKLRGKFVMTAAASNCSGAVSRSGQPVDGRAASDDGQSAPARRRRPGRGSGGGGAAMHRRSGEVAWTALWRDAACTTGLRAASSRPGSAEFPESAESSFTSMKAFWLWSAPARRQVASRAERCSFRAVASRGVNDPPVPAQISLAAEHYGMLMRNVEKGVPVALEMNIENKFYDDDLNSFNVIGEIAGTDKADEVVMIGAHFDSWHTGTGATDNAAGSAIMMEVMRILKATGLPLRRTVRIALWTGEEQGLFGSQAYVRDHFAVRQRWR